MLTHYQKSQLYRIMLKIIHTSCPAGIDTRCLAYATLDACNNIPGLSIFHVYGELSWILRDTTNPHYLKVRMPGASVVV